MRIHRPHPVPVPCAQCGVAFRAAYTNGRCPVCDTPVASDAIAGRSQGRVGKLIGDRWPVVLIGVAVAGNLIIAILVARAVGG